jgi:hypothetical protein
MGSLAALQGCGGDDDDNGGDGSKGGEAGDGSGGTATGGRGGSSTGGTSTGGRGGSSTGGSSTGGSSTGGAGGAPGGMGGEDTGGGAGGASGGDREAACTEYCELYYEVGCEMFDANYYVNVAGCQGNCNVAIWELGEPGDMAGNSVHCRLTHAGLASEGMTQVHCGHAAANSTGQCVAQ